MRTKLREPQKRILSTTLSVMNQFPEDKFTVRTITKNSHVNVAAINYYFGSKSQLVEETYRVFQQKLESVFLTLDDTSASKENLFQFLLKVEDFVYQYSGIVKKYIQDLIQQEDTKINIFSEKCINLLADFQCKIDEDLSNEKAHHDACFLLSNLLSAEIFSCEITKKCDLKSKKYKEEWIQRLIKII